ncbi:hypothetical protein HAX54_012312 [Datura stramonium]|uniref:Uncharacterized protein n=1 Tax=Datura stramonium TaxID=4076 RepID=A0ABS8TJK0_DATST|nr:hypothetical protein [Datura stramonium]
MLMSAGVTLEKAGKESKRQEKGHQLPTYGWSHRPQIEYADRQSYSKLDAKYLYL